MRGALALALLAAACNHVGDQCTKDSDCGGGNVCARDEACWPSNEVRPVKLTWTIGGAPVGSDSCAPYPDFFVDFWSYNEEFGFAPVPCIAGEFPVDKLPTVYTETEIGNDGTTTLFDLSSSIDENGSASFDLVP
jgi:hypothetical protein